MGILSDVKRVKAIEADTKKSAGTMMLNSGMGYGISNNRGWQYPGSIQDLLYQMYGPAMQGLTNPRDRLIDYRLIYENIAPYANAINIKRSLIGNPIIESKDKVFANEINARLAELKSTGELRNAYAKDSGIATMLDELIPDLFIDGSAFVTFEDADGVELQKANSKLECVRVHDALRFDYQETGIPDDYVLNYIRQGIQTKITNYRDTFRVMQFDRTKWLWGKPLGYHTPFILRAWLVSLGAREQSNSRIGAPLELTIFGTPAPTASLDPASAMAYSEDARNASESAATAYRTAIANKNSKLNQGVDIVGVAPSDMKVTTHRYGEGAMSPVNFQLEFELYLKFAASSWDVPLVLTGLQSGSGGIGSEEFKYAAAFATNAAAKHQYYLDSNIIRPIITRMMSSERRNQPDYTIAWDGETIEDVAAKAETKQAEASANLTAMQGLELARQLISPAEATEWARRAGLEYLTF